MKIINSKNLITASELKDMAEKSFESLVKAVVDVEEERMAVNAEMHSDEEQYLLEDDSKQSNLWGINLYPDLNEEERVEFDSMINLRPSQNNRSRGINNSEVKNKIIKIVNNLVNWNE